MASLLNVTPQRVSQLSKEPGFPPKIARGEYDTNKTVLWYIKHLQAELKRRGPAGTADSADIAAERLKLVAAQAVKVQTENHVRAGNLLTCDDVRVTWNKLVANAQKRLRSIPASLGPQLTNKSDPAYIVDRLKNEIEKALEELAGGDRVREFDSGDGEEDMGAAA